MECLSNSIIIAQRKINCACRVMKNSNKYRQQTHWRPSFGALCSAGKRSSHKIRVTSPFPVWRVKVLQHKPFSNCNYFFTRTHVAKPSCLMDKRFSSPIYRFMKRAMDINSQPTAKGQKLSKQPKCWNQTPVPAMPKEGNSTPAMTSQHITQTFLYGSLSHYLLDVGG